MVNCFTIRDTIHKEQNELIAEFKEISITIILVGVVFILDVDELKFTKIECRNNKNEIY